MRSKDVLHQWPSSSIASPVPTLFCSNRGRPLMPHAHLQVVDRAVVKTADAERKVIQPEGLQASIDQAVKVVPSGQQVSCAPHIAEQMKSEG